MSKYGPKYGILIENDDVYGKIFRMIEPGSRILEFGPASGYITEVLANHFGCEVYIVELFEDDFEKAMEFAKDGLCGDLEKYDWLSKWQDMKFDSIIFADVLEHLYDPWKALAESKALLKESGSVFISLPNIMHRDVMTLMYQNRFPYVKLGLLDETHIRFFGHADLKSMAEDAGFTIVSEDGVVLEETELHTLASEGIQPPKKWLSGHEYANIYQFVLKLQHTEYVLENNIAIESKMAASKPKRLFQTSR